MNFFQAQAKARNQTKNLVFLFALAVISLVILANLLVMGLFGYLNLGEGPLTLAFIKSQFDWEMFGVIGLIVVSFILIGSVYKISAISGGGKVVAESLGGDLLHHSSDNLQYKILLNVVEEMAIAAGTPVPPVYVLRKEKGINAFAAGFNTDDAVIGVTQGALDCFDREELQGVIAHEFSHIINGDMRLNMRLIGILHGILLIGTVGYYIMRFSGGSSKSKKGNQLVFLGLGLVIIGYGGTFFGKAIKASVSRQREFLADASAVQFTRNNLGISNALKKIGGYKAGSKLETPEAQTVSHAFFSNALTNKFTSLFATHPPLPKRISQIDPSWKGKFEETKPLHMTADSQNISSLDGGVYSTLESSTTNSDANVHQGATTEVKTNTELSNGIGQINQSHIERARSYLAEIPKQLMEAVHTTNGAQAYVYALLLSDQPTAESTQSGTEDRQWGYLSVNLPSDIYFQARSIFNLVDSLAVQHRLPLLEIALPQMRQMPRLRYEAMLRQMQYLIFSDSKLSIFEWSIANIVSQYLKTEFETADKRQVKHMSTTTMQPFIETMLSVLIHEFCSESDSRSILLKAQRLLNLSNITLRDKADVSVEDYAEAVNKLRQLAFYAKEKVLQLCIFVVTRDQVYSPQEHEAIRALAECLGCPMPVDVSTDLY